MTRIIPLVLITLSITLIQSCSFGPYEEEVKQQRDSLLQAQEDSLISVYMSEIESIDDKLKSITTKNGIFDQNERPEDLSKDVILKRVEMLDELLESNQSQLDKLLSKIEKNEVRNNELQSMVEEMRSRISQKEAQIDDLMGLLTDKDMKIDEILLRMDSMRIDNIELAEEVIKLDEELHLVYYVVDEKEELIEQKIITKSGGLLGIGSTKKLDAESLDRSKFTEVDERDLISVPLYSKRAKVITNHPDGSYKIVMDENDAPQSLDILDRKAFWSVSDYLVVEVKN